MPQILLALAQAAFMGVPIVVLLSQLPFKRFAFVQTILGASIGIGVSSCVYFLWLVLAGASSAKVFLVDGLLILGLLYFYWIRRRIAPNSRPVARDTGAGKVQWLMPLCTGLCFFAGCIICACFFAEEIREYPHGNWDAWCTWNLRARFLFWGGEHWQQGLSPAIAWSHPQYPLLIPGAIARCWAALGGASKYAPTAIAFWFTFGTVGLLTATVAAVRGATQGFLAGLFLLGAVGLTRNGAQQYADIPLSFFFLASLSCLYLHRYFEVTGGLILAGLCAGLAAWTKDEGSVFLMLLLVINGVLCLCFASFKEARKETLHLIAGAALPLMCLFLFKSINPCPSGFHNDGLAANVARILSWERHWVILGYMGDALLDAGSWRDKSGLILLGAYVFVSGVKIPSLVYRVFATILCVLIFQFIAYYAIYLITPLDLDWHISHSIDRLFLHLFPGLILVAFLAMGSPKVHGRPPSPS